MSSLIIPIICFVVSIFIFLSPVRNTLADAEPLKAQKVSLETALSKAVDITKRREDLEKKYIQFSDEEKTKLEKLIPENVDNVRLIIDINDIANRHGMTVKNVVVKTESEEQAQTATGGLGPSTDDFTTLTLSFSVNGSYDNLRQFLTDLEHSLRIVDIQSITFTSAQVNSYQYAITLKTYWLRSK